MGLLVGNTTVIEHAGTYVEWKRTYSHEKYAPICCSIGFVVPQGVSLPDAYKLARAVVNAQLGLCISDAAEVDALCQLVFGQHIKEFFVDHSGPTISRGQRR